MRGVRAILAILVLGGVLGAVTEAHSGIRFLPSSQAFWDNSENWTTEYGPAYRDTVEGLDNMVPCTGPYAYCFHSGPEPLPCVLSKDGRSANCKCTVANGLNYVLISAILNRDVYLDTVATCGPDGKDCAGHPDRAPVCQAIRDGNFLPGAQVISTFAPEAFSAISSVLSDPPASPFKNCDKGPYAGCMTASCRLNRGGADAQCDCPVFRGRFLLIDPDAACHIGNGLVWSSSFNPHLLEGD